jgi:hypothetical protein
MTENFKKVVNLQAKAAERSEFSRQSQPAVPSRTKRSRAEEIDRVFANDVGNEDEKKELGRIERPLIRSERSNSLAYGIIFFLVLLLVAGAVYFLVLKKEDKVRPENVAEAGRSEGRWYSVQLSSGEIYYGFIKNTASDPIVLERVYYNYDQINKPQSGVEGTEKSDNSSIRLVKRGKEAHGPDGSMDIVRAQALYMEPLAEESKILKAILEYEKE